VRQQPAGPHRAARAPQRRGVPAAQAGAAGGGHAGGPGRRRERGQRARRHVPARPRAAHRHVRQALGAHGAPPAPAPPAAAAAPALRIATAGPASREQPRVRSDDSLRRQRRLGAPLRQAVARLAPEGACTAGYFYCSWRDRAVQQGISASDAGHRALRRSSSCPLRTWRAWRPPRSRTRPTSASSRPQRRRAPSARARLSEPVFRL